MKNKNISEMTKEERKTHLLMLINSYRHMLLYDIITDNPYGEIIWKKAYMDATRIYINMMTMEGKIVMPYDIT